MTTPLDSLQFIQQKDPANALQIAASQFRQTGFEATVVAPEHDGRWIQNVVVTGMGGSALAALLAKVWLRQDISVPFEVVRGYELPASVTQNTLVIASSYSGNTEETLSALAQASDRGAQIGIIASGGALLQKATEANIAHVALPSGLQPRMAVIYNLRALTALLENFTIVENKSGEIAFTANWLGRETAAWDPTVPAEQNYAKQLAEQAVGKTAIFYGGALTAPVAYKWKISWNENAKNVAFWNEYPEFNHNEFMGWDSHPIEKPFAVFDLLSDLENPRITRRFALSDQLLSGKRPKATPIQLKGATVLEQLLWGSILADYVSIYVAILNGVDPTPVDLIERFKKELG